MRLIVITTETFFEGEAEAINLLFENGLEVLHIRKPFASIQENEVFIGQISKNFHARIVIHDHYELTKNFDLKGIHLKQRCPSLVGTKQSNDHRLDCFVPRNDGLVPRSDDITPHSSFPRNLSISRSCHLLEEVSESHFWDYVFLSPIFDSISKTGYKKGFTPEQLNMAKERKIINEYVIALGGITSDNIPIISSYGFGGVAVLGALWRDFAVCKNFNELQERYNELKIKCTTV